MAALTVAGMAPCNLVARAIRGSAILLLLLSSGRLLPAEKPSGRELAHDVHMGNCLACHQIPGDAAAVTRANIGPALVGMKQRFPDRADLRKQIWDASARNPQTVMPPFGKHGVLTEEQIDLIVDYLYQY